MTGRTTSGTSGGATTGDDEVAAAARLVADLARATAGTPTDLRRLAGLLGDRYGPDSRLLARGVELALLDAVADPGARGWGARDLVEIVRRRVGASAVPLVLDVVAGEAARRPHGGGPEDVAELAALGAEVWWDRGRPLLEQWAATRRLAPPAALRAALGVVHTLRTLPTLPRREGAAGAPPGVDARVLARVRGLLAKAESTTFAEEAEALSAKAQELMARHALEAAVVGAAPTGSGPGGEAATRRIWLDAPYASAKAHLVHRVASANRCRAVTLDALDMVTVVGHPADLGTVELLVTSLLVQADRAMLTAPEAETVGRERTRSFRHAFLLSYATRIGERLAAATHEAQVRARAEVGESLLPVLAARAEVVDAAVGDLFPRITTRRASVGNRDGWFAGRAAADAASLSPGRDALDRRDA